ncbi:mercuric reductase [Nodosilinea sp. LEGE 07298]|uniref:mercuric reductase n=1 Tax=Nodosilinea sp. LEGE 07298 TaxID=2777970 RepID=UPI0018800590|nr:mercuric reductase [Nodosilinea sp. LEGE 07298]MBE9108765.1 mercuric reductase [Nodosilinea sp. LEGE 07298]
MTQTYPNSVTVPPMDAHNQRLVSYLHPPDWSNPVPAERYNLVVIGAGTAGLVTAAGAAMLGAKVALVEQHLMGGDCTNVGCVPSKAMIRSARAVQDVRQAHRYGVQVPDGVQVNFAQVMERLRQVRAEISENDSAQRIQSEYGVDIFFGKAAFSGGDTITVGDQTLRFRKAAIATGSSPVQLPIDGLEEAGYLTNETVFNLTECPPRLAIIGGGYIGCELAQTFQRLGSQVTLLQRGDRILKKSDPEVSDLMQRIFVAEGIDLKLDAQAQRIERHGDEKVIHYQQGDESHTVVVDEILVGVGRKPNSQGLGLEQVGVEADPKQGICINDYLQTTNPNIYAVGDCCMRWKFTHAADAAARILIQNALFAVFGIGRRQLSGLTMPWCTYTDPEVAHVGLPASQVAERQNVRTFTLSLSEVDRAITDGETDGFAKIHLDGNRDKILGATVVARHAGEMINEITLAMEKGLGLGAIANVIHPYPTQAEVIRKVADEYSLSRFTPFVKKLAATWLRWRR